MADQCIKGTAGSVTTTMCAASDGNDKGMVNKIIIEEGGKAPSGIFGNIRAYVKRDASQANSAEEKVATTRILTGGGLKAEDFISALKNNPELQKAATKAGLGFKTVIHDNSPLAIGGDVETRIYASEISGSKGR